MKKKELCPITNKRDVRCGYMMQEEGGWICTREEPTTVDDEGFCDGFIKEEKSVEERIEEKGW